MEKILLEDINRLKSIMDLPILNEGRGDLVMAGLEYLSKNLGLAGKTVDNIANIGIKNSEGTIIKYGKEGAKILKKLVDEKNTEPTFKLIDDLYKANPTLGKFIYSQIRKEFPVTFKAELDKIIKNAKEMSNSPSLDDGEIGQWEYFVAQIRDVMGPDVSDDVFNGLVKREAKNNDILIKAIPEIKVKPKVTNNGSSSVDNVVPDNVVPSISKTLSEVVEDLTEKEVNTLFEYASTKPWFKFSKRFMSEKLKMIRFGKALQEETIQLIASLRKTSDTKIETSIMNQIIENVQKLQTNEKLLYQELNNWVEKYLKESTNKDIKLIYKKLTKNQGWNKVIPVDGFFSKILGGVKFGLREYSQKFKDLSTAWLRVITSPVTLPLQAMVRIFKNDMKWVAKLSPAEKKSFWNWYLTSSPTAWSKVRTIYGKFGFPGAASYVTSQVARRYISLKLIGGFLTSAIALGLRFTDVDVESNPILKKYFSFDDDGSSGTKNFFNKAFSDVLNFDAKLVHPAYVTAVLSKDLINYLYDNKWAEAKVVVDAEIEKIESGVEEVVNEKIYTEENLVKFKEYMSEELMVPIDTLPSIGEVTFDDKNFIMKMSDGVVKYTYNPLTKKFKYVK